MPRGFVIVQINHGSFNLFEELRGFFMNTPNVNDSASDQRYFPRWEVTNRVLYHTEKDTQLHKGTTKDLSCSGACIQTEKILTPGRKLTMTVWLSTGVKVNLQGTVAWVKMEGEKNFIGIDFFNTSQEAQDLILEHAFELNQDKLTNHWFKGWKKA